MYFDTKDFAQRLKNARRILGYTQEMVSDKINIFLSYYGKIEVGGASPSIDVMIELAELYHLSLDYLILGKESENDIVKHKVRSMIEFLSAVDREL